MGTASLFHIERCWGIKKGFRDVVEKNDCLIRGFIVCARRRLCLVLLVMAESGPFMFFFSVGSTRVISVHASHSSYTLENASAGTLSFPGLCMISKS